MFDQFDKVFTYLLDSCFNMENVSCLDPGRRYLFFKKKGTHSST